MIYTSYLFFRRSRWLPVCFMWEIALSFLIVFIDAVFVALSLGISTGKPVSQFLQAPTPEEVGQLIGLAIIGLIWIPYILKSRRVANTFVR